LQADGVIGLVAQDMAAETEDRDIEQALLDHVEQVEDAARPAVAVGERMDGLELAVARRHAHEGVDVRGALQAAVHPLLPVGQLLAEQGLALWRRVDDLPGAVFAEGGTGRLADVHVHALDRATDLHGRVRG
jgi:hypothetical protein